jgi:hypothetical protein
MNPAFVPLTYPYGGPRLVRRKISENLRFRLAGQIAGGLVRRASPEGVP